MLRTFDVLIVTPMRGSFLPRSYRSIHQTRGVFSTVLLKSVAVCFYAACRAVWTAKEKAVDGRKARAEAKGFLQKWKDGGQTLLTIGLMADVCGVFSRLQKQFQDNNVTLAEVEDVLGSAVGQLEMIREAPRVGGFEASVTYEEEDDEEPDGVTGHTESASHPWSWVQCAIFCLRYLVLY